MINFLYQKYKNTKLKQKIVKGKKVIIEGEIKCTCPEKVNLSDYVYIGENCRFYGSGELHVDENVIIGNDVKILTTNHNYEGTMLPYDSLAVNKNVCIEKNVWIASFVLILPGVTIHEGGGDSCWKRSYKRCAMRSCSWR